LVEAGKKKAKDMLKKKAAYLCVCSRTVSRIQCFASTVSFFLQVAPPLHCGFAVASEYVMRGVIETKDCQHRRTSLPTLSRSLL